MSVRQIVALLGAPLALPRGQGQADAIVVLGCPCGPDGGLSELGEERVACGVELWRAGLAPVVCVTGFGEAPTMAARARALGVPDECLRLETAAHNTRENAFFSAALLIREGRRRVWVVTQPFHLRRAVYWCRRAGLEPLAWRMDDSLEWRQPARGLRWVAREYAAWGAHWQIELATWWRRRRMR